MLFSAPPRSLIADLDMKPLEGWPRLARASQAELELWAERVLTADSLTAVFAG